MGLFTEKEKIETYQTPESRRAGGYMSSLMGQELTAPGRQVAQLSPFQRSLMESAQASLPQMQQYYQTAGDVMMSTARGDYDPYTGQHYQNLREQGERAKTEAGTQARQRAEMGGALYSTPGAALESDARTGVESVLQNELGRLYESERQRQMGAAQALPGLAAQQTAQYGQMASLTDFQRQVEQQQYDAVYQQAMQQMMAPYQYNAALAQALYNPQTVVTGGGLTDLGFGMQFLGDAVEMAAKAVSGGAGGSGGSGGGGFGTPGMMRQ